MNKNTQAQTQKIIQTPSTTHKSTNSKKNHTNLEKSNPHHIKHEHEIKHEHIKHLNKKTNPENLKSKKLALDPHQHKIIHEQIRKIKPPHHQSIKHKTQTQNFCPQNTKTLNSKPKISGTKENRRKERVWFSYLSEKPTQNQLKPTQNSTILNPTINDPSI